MVQRIVVIALVVACSSAAEARCRGGQNISWYGEPQQLSGGGEFRPDGLTCASRDHRRGTVLRVTVGERSVDCLVNDHGPSAATGCLLDVSRGSARKLGILERGVVRARIEAIGPARKPLRLRAEGGYVAQNWPAAADVAAETD